MNVQRKVMFWGILAGGVAVLLCVNPAAAAVTAFFGDLAGFNTAAGSPPVVVNFDTMIHGTNIDGAMLGGITFNPASAPSAPLIVVTSASTYTPAGFTGVIDADTNKLPATSGEMILSPGGYVLGPGPDPAVENDDLQLTFGPGVSAIGFDVLFQSRDYASYTSVTVYGPSNEVLYSQGSIPVAGGGGAGAPGGSVFVGFVSSSANIARIVLDESDDNAINPDCNIGYDTFRMTPGATIPAPGAIVLAALGASLVGGLRRRGTL
jgi:hypothetical protein